MILTAITMVTKRFELTMIEPVTQAEFGWFEMCLTEDFENAECTITQSGRIIMVEGLETIHELISVLAQNEFMHDLGLIREVIDYEPQFEDDELLIAIEFDD